MRHSVVANGPDPLGVFGVGYDEEGEVSRASPLPGKVRVDPTDPRIDVSAKFALQRMLRGDADAQRDATAMIGAIQAGQLAGIYGDDLYAAVKVAQRWGTSRWLLVPKGEDAALILDPAAPTQAPPTIIFRGGEGKPPNDGVRRIPQRLDPALRKAWAVHRLLQGGGLARCDLPLPAGPPANGMTLETQPFLGAPLANVVPPILCNLPLPQPARPKPLPPLDQARPGETFCSGGLDVRQINDRPIAAAVKREIHFNPGPIISQHMPGDPTRLNPEFPSGKVVVIPFETTDHPRNPHVTRTYLASVFFKAGASALSAKNYFAENSWGQFQLRDGGISDWVRVPGRLSDFGPLDGPALLSQVLRAAIVDWRALDSNGDGRLTRGEVTIIYLIPNADSKLTRGFAHVRRPPPFPVETPAGRFTFDLPIVQFSLVEATDPAAATNPIRRLSSVCHELCHAFFELPDRYGTTTGTGLYDIMSNDRFFEHMNLHDKMKIGWIQPRVVRGHRGHCLAFPASESTKAGLVVVSPETAGAPLTADEYWVIENRHKESSAGGFDRDLPESGLAVWWVKTGGLPNGHDDVRLVDFSKPDQIPTAYQNPGPSALFKRNDKKLLRRLVDGRGRRSFAFLRGISGPGRVMFGES